MIVMMMASTPSLKPSSLFLPIPSFSRQADVASSEDSGIVCLWEISYRRPMETITRPEIPPGTLHMMVLKTLARVGPMHGYGIAQHIQQASDDVLGVEEGSLYPALQRMLVKGWV